MTARRDRLGSARFVGRARTHAQTRWLQLWYGDTVHVVALREKTALVVPLLNIHHEATDPVFSFRFTVKLSELDGLKLDGAS